MAQLSGMWTLSQVAQAVKNNLWTGQPPSTIEYLVVAGGGGGAYDINDSGGGGGGGGLIQGLTSITQGTSYYVTVGGGGATGAGGTTGSNGANGSNSVLFSTSSGAYTGTFVAQGGGGGGANRSDSYARTGGSGGGGASGGIISGGSGTSGQGNSGGTGYVGSGSVNSNSGGGGGAGTVGISGVSGVTGNGGAGIASTISGSLVTYGGGGGAGGYTINNTVTGGTGGVGGGGTGGSILSSSSATNATTGSSNSGGGGGGCSRYSGGATAQGASGGSGIVIVRYKGNQQWFTGGTLSYDSVNNYTVHTFYANGVLTPLASPVTYGTTASLTKSLRFRSSATSYLSRTPASSGNQKTWTFSAWIKIGTLTGDRVLFSGGTSSRLGLLLSDANLIIDLQGTGAYQTSVQVFRDTSAWYHIVWAFDTTQATGANRSILYVNGTAIPLTQSITFTQNANYNINSNTLQTIGVYSNYLLAYTFDGEMAEVNFIDGQALTPQSFGQYDSTTGVWQPMTFVGTYGTNGYYLPFTNTTSTTTIGYDSSGNGNNFATSGISLTAGSTYDSMLDVPTLSSTASNYAVLNPALNTSAAPYTISNGNLGFSTTTAFGSSPLGSIAMSSGKWYWEVTPTSNWADGGCVGICGTQYNPNWGNDSYYWYFSYGYGYNMANGKKNNNASQATYGASYSSGDVVGIAFDATNGTLTFYKNGTSQGVAYTGISGSFYPAIYIYGTGGASGNINFGQQPFVYTPPSGYVALNTYNLPTPAIIKGSNYFTPILYLGNRPSSQQIGPLNFQPDFIWVKGRSNSWDNSLFDSVRGASKDLVSNTTTAEITEAGVSAFNSASFNVGSAPSENQPNENFVAWCWSANSGTNVTNTSGSITSTISANQTSGFSIVTYTGTGANATVGHGLGVAPSMIILKRRDNGTDNWRVYHSSLGAGNVMSINTANASASSSASWNNTAPTSSVFSVGTESNTNASGSAIVAYCFAQISGFSAFGSYIGNSSGNGPFVYCGFQPKFVMIKMSSSNGYNWNIFDTSRNTYNVANLYLAPNASAAEGSSTAFDFLSNGFKIRSISAFENTSGETYIYMAFASNPFRNSLAF